MNIKVRIIKTSSIECGIVYAVLLRVNDELVLDISILKSRVRVVDTSREPVVALRKYLPVIAYCDRTDLSAGILGPGRDVLCKVEVVLRPSPCFT